MRSAVRLEAGSRSLYDSCRNQVSRVCVIYSVIPLRFDLAIDQNGELFRRLQDPVVWHGHADVAENCFERSAPYSEPMKTQFCGAAVSSDVISKRLFVSDPSSVNLEKVSNIIVDQSLKDQVFSKEAGRICYTIVQVSFSS